MYTQKFFFAYMISTRADLPKFQEIYHISPPQTARSERKSISNLDIYCAAHRQMILRIRSDMDGFYLAHYMPMF